MHESSIISRLIEVILETTISLAYRCLKSKDIGIKGMFHSKEFNLLSITVRRCSSSCTSANFHGGFIDFIFVSAK